MHYGPPPTRRDAILSSALELFRSRGFHAVGIDEIGTAAGISGPGVYRHFRSKDSLLCALFDDISERLLDRTRKILTEAAGPRENLEALVSLHVSFAVQDRGLLAVWLQDWRSLPEADRRRLHARQLDYIGEWTGCLAEMRPELSKEEVETVAYAAISAINSIASHSSKMERDELEPVLRRLALAVLSA